MKANLSFIRFSVRGKSKVENELGFSLMVINLRKYTTKIQNNYDLNNKKTCGINIFTLFPQVYLI